MQQQKGHIGLRERLAAVLLLVACLLLLFRDNIGTALNNILILGTALCYLYFLWNVQQAVQKQKEHPQIRKLVKAYVAVVGVTLLNLFFFGFSYHGFLLAASVLLLCCFVLLLFLRSYR